MIPKYASQYAIHHIGQRFEEAEPAIAKNIESGFDYTKKFFNGKRWSKYEKTVVNDLYYAARYALEVSKERFKEAEPAIRKLDKWMLIIEFLICIKMNSEVIETEQEMCQRVIQEYHIPRDFAEKIIKSLDEHKELISKLKDA